MILIDADVENKRLLDFITQNDSEIQYAIEHKDRKMLEDIFLDCFNELETTFDLESVIKQLENEKLKHKNYSQQDKEDGYDIYMWKEQGITQGIEIAVEILKSAANITNGG